MPEHVRARTRRVVAGRTSSFFHLVFAALLGAGAADLRRCRVSLGVWAGHRGQLCEAAPRDGDRLRAGAERAGGAALLRGQQRQARGRAAARLAAGASISNIFKNINIELFKGEVLGLSGLLGSGSNELLRSIFGIIKQDNGQIFLNEEIITINKPKDAVSVSLIHI